MLFSKKYSLSDCGALDGFTDWHSHILPGVDDGVKNAEDSLRILARYQGLGVKEVWLTPHMMEDMPNTTADLRERFGKLQEAYTGGIPLHLASENMMDNLFMERLEADDLLPLQGRHLLVETSYFNPPMGMDGILARIKSKGYRPVLAHPERYVYMGKKDYVRLKDQDIILQLNIFSLVGFYGEEAKEKAGWLLKNGMYSLSGSDIHSTSYLERPIHHKSMDRKTKDLLLALQSHSELPL